MPRGKHGTSRHLLSGIDPETRRGFCSVCGPVDLAAVNSSKYGLTFRCGNSYRESQQKSKARWKESENGRRSARISVLKHRYGVSEQEVLDLLAKQNYKCPICGEEVSFYRGDLDHCHKTGAARGVLCHAHNKGLGFFQDNPAHLQNAITYLTQQKETQHAD